MAALKASSDEVEVSFQNLSTLGLIGSANSGLTGVQVMPKARMLLRAVRD
jgi:hypothetical protein